MKKLIYSTFGVILALPVMVSAATFSFAPVSGTYTPGETISVAVYVNPSAGEEITTAKLSATFPASVLEVVSFTQASGWMPLSQPGYDAVDNVTGSVIKTGGYPSKVTTSQLFGTLTLKTKADGTGVLSVAGDSLLLDPTNADMHTSSSAATFTVATPVPVTPPAPVVESVVESEPTPTPIVAPVTEEAPEEATTTDKEATTTSTTTDENQAASVVSTGTNTYWYWILLALIILAILALLWRHKRNKASDSQNLS